jgi:molybdate transport system ATP-binding protein
MINININKSLYGSNGKMDLDINLEIKNNEFIALSGDSGSGKTTILRILAGLEKSKGQIVVDGTIWQKDNYSLPTQKREIGFVFQDYALFNNMTVEQNLLFVKNNKQLSTKLLKMTNLEKLKDRLPASLSGGQKQRVSLCRAYMNQPKLLLMDEPLSALDSSMRTKLQNEILTLHKEFGTTTIMVSHDLSEIYRLSSRVLILKNGIIIDDSTPKDILLKNTNDTNLSFQGELLDIIKVDIINIAIVSVGQQIIKIVVSNLQIKNLIIGSKVNISTNSFAPIILS